MEVVFHKFFLKDFDKIPLKVQKRVKVRLELFLKDRFHPQLRLHALKGEYAGCFSINIKADYRVILHVDSNCIYMIRIGTHSQLYG